jgi:hypothetical protein
MSPILIAALTMTAGLPQADVESFTDNRDGTATLTVVCASGPKVTFRVDRKRLDMMDVDAIYAIVRLECGKVYGSTPSS